MVIYLSSCILSIEKRVFCLFFCKCNEFTSRIDTKTEKMIENNRFLAFKILYLQRLDRKSVGAQTSGVFTNKSMQLII